jgi:hypothetical protein
MSKLATVAAGVVSCRLLVVGGATVGASVGVTLGTSSCPDLGTSARLDMLAVPVEGEDPPPLPVTLTDLPLSPSEV